MFGNKKEESNNISNLDLQIENEKLKINVETLKFKLEQMNEKYFILEQKIKEAKNTDAEKIIEKIKQENDSLKKELADLKFKIANNTNSIELETENKKLKSEIDIQKTENKHLKDLLDTYRAMPDVKNMVDNLSSLAVPHMNELKEFSKIISDSKITKLCEELTRTNDSMRSVCSQMGYYVNNHYIR